jgi:hypothetical protein
MYSNNFLLACKPSDFYNLWQVESRSRTVTLFTMSWHRRNNLWRRLTSGLLLVAYVATCAGVVPFPASVFTRKGGQPFLCQDHPCGCATAEDCWRHCCCFTAEERWAWARENNIEPPEYAERPSAENWSTARLRDRTENEDVVHSDCTHCQASVKQNACCEPSTQTSCCRHESAAKEDHSASTTSVPRAPVLLSAWRCQGLSTVWLSTGAVMPIVPSATWVPYESCVGSIADSDSRPALLPFVPPDPPPRQA